MMPKGKEKTTENDRAKRWVTTSSVRSRPSIAAPLAQNEARAPGPRGLERSVRPLLERYVRACEAARCFRAEIPAGGTSVGSAGQLVEHPLVKTVRQAERDAHRYECELLAGFEPAEPAEEELPPWARDDDDWP